MNLYYENRSKSVDFFGNFPKRNDNKFGSFGEEKISSARSFDIETLFAVDLCLFAKQLRTGKNDHRGAFAK